MTRFEAHASSDADITRQEPSGPTTQRDPSGLVRGAVLAGKYRLEAQLGAGGMAVVWSAYHLELEIPVAIKLLRGHDPSLARRLKLEARAAARLAHPAMVRVLDVAATEEGEPFIVMELLTGETLADALARGNLSALRVVQLLLPIVEGLALAHDHGVVHRDLKPENVFLASEGELLQPKLLDFGIAKLAGGVAARRLTANGTALGSPSYMSPEQARGEEVDHLSDVWSFCVLLYKAIGGKAPFRGAAPRDVLDAILRQAPPPLPLGTGADGHLARIVLSGLNKDPAARPTSMRQLGQQLARWLLLHGVPVDVCGAPLVSKWSNSDPPTRPRASDAPPRRSPLPPPPSLPSQVDSTTEITLRDPVRAAPAARPSGAVSARKVRFVATKGRRALWALAGVMIAGGSLALTTSNRSQQSQAAAGSSTVAKQAPVLAGTNADLGTPEPQLDQLVAVSDVDASTANRDATDVTDATASTATPSAATTAQRPAALPRTKSFAPTPLKSLPF